MKGCWPAILVCGGSFAALQFGISNWHGPTLVNVVGGIASLVATAIFLQFWQPKEIWRFPEEEEGPPCRGGLEAASAPPPHQSRSASRDLLPRQVAYAWMPWVLLSVMVFLWGWPAWKEFLNGGTAERPNLLRGISQANFEVPWLHNVVYRTGPVVKMSPGADRAEHPEPALIRFQLAFGHGHGHFPGGRALGLLAADLARGLLERVRPHAVPRPLGTADHRLHVGPGIHHEI